MAYEGAYGIAREKHARGRALSTAATRTALGGRVPCRRSRQGHRSRRRGAPGLVLGLTPAAARNLDMVVVVDLRGGREIVRFRAERLAALVARHDGDLLDLDPRHHEAAEHVREEVAVLPARLVV